MPSGKHVFFLAQYLRFVRAIPCTIHRLRVAEWHGQGFAKEVTIKSVQAFVAWVLKNSGEEQTPGFYDAVLELSSQLTTGLEEDHELENQLG